MHSRTGCTRVTFSSVSPCHGPALPSCRCWLTLGKGPGGGGRSCDPRSVLCVLYPCPASAHEAVAVAGCCYAVSEVICQVLDNASGQRVPSCLAVRSPLLGCCSMVGPVTQSWYKAGYPEQGGGGLRVTAEAPRARDCLLPRLCLETQKCRDGFGASPGLLQCTWRQPIMVLTPFRS